MENVTEGGIKVNGFVWIKRTVTNASTKLLGLGFGPASEKVHPIK